MDHKEGSRGIKIATKKLSSLRAVYELNIIIWFHTY